MKNKQQKCVFIIIPVMVAILVGCAGSIPKSTAEPSGTIENKEPSPLPDDTLGEATPVQQEQSPVETLPPTLEDIETIEPEAVGNEVPDELLEKIIADLVARTNRDRDAIQVIMAQAVIWSDGSLGCPQPGMFYTQSLIEGYQVRLMIGEREYDYHASESGNFLLCEGQEDSPASHPDKPGLRTVP